MSEKKLSSKEFQLFIRTLMSNVGPTVKYQNPTLWRRTE